MIECSYTPSTLTNFAQVKSRVRCRKTCIKQESVYSQAEKMLVKIVEHYVWLSFHCTQWTRNFPSFELVVLHSGKIDSNFQKNSSLTFLVK